MDAKTLSGITYIDGRPWIVTLPDGGSNREQSEQSEFARMVNLAGKDIFHCQMASWCSNRANEIRWDENGEGVFWHESGYVRQFDGTKDNWDIKRAGHRGYSTGFRPILIPADPETLQPDLTYLTGIKDGTVLHLGTLYMGGDALPNPTDPIGSGQPKYGMTGPPEGNVPRHRFGAVLELKDTHPDPDMQIRFIKAGDRLISDRVILGCVSMDDLQSHLTLQKCPSSHQLPEGPVNLSARLGISLTVTPEEFAVLRDDPKNAADLLIQLIHSDRCAISGDTYFPEPWNEEYLEDDLNFDLPYTPLQAFAPLMDTHEKDTTHLTLDSRLSDAQFRTGCGHSAAPFEQEAHIQHSTDGR